MPRHPLPHYLLTLAEDDQERAKFTASIKSARDSMTAAGLSDEDQSLLLRGDTKEISDAIAKLYPEKSGQTCFSASVCRTPPPTQ
jgi:hypothetical protein